MCVRLCLYVCMGVIWHVSHRDIDIENTQIK